MNKKQFADKLALKLGVTKAQGMDMVNGFTELVGEILASGDDINIVGFGKFLVSELPERNGMNPQTKEPMKLKATKIVRFSAGETLKKAVRGEN